MGGHSGKYVAYYGCTAWRQDQSVLGLDAQKAAVTTYLNGGKWQIIAEFVEIENGRKTRRPQLQAAIAAAKRARAMLLVAKLDTLTSNVHFLTTLLESGVRFRAVEMPEADKRMFQLMLVLAEWEARQASRRQKAALQAAKARGVRLGNPTILAATNTARREAAQSRAEALRPTLQGLRQRGFSQREMVEELNRLSVPAARGGKWSFMPLQRVLKRLGFTGKPTPQHPRVGMSKWLARPQSRQSPGRPDQRSVAFAIQAIVAVSPADLPVTSMSDRLPRITTRSFSIEHETFMNEEFFRTSVLHQLEAARRVGRVGLELRSKTNGPERPSLGFHPSSSNQSRGKRRSLRKRRQSVGRGVTKVASGVCPRGGPAGVCLSHC